MTIRKVTKFTPEVMIGAPRRSVGIPDSSGRYIVYRETSYSFEKHEQSAEIRVIDVQTSQSSLVIDDKNFTNPVWLEDDTIAMLKSSEKDVTELVVGPLHDFKTQHYVAGKIDGPADNLKVSKLERNAWGIAVSAAANPDGSIHNPSKAPKPRSSARLFDSLFVRHWDKWITPQRNALFYGALEFSRSPHEEQIKRWALSPLTNALKGTSLESPIEPFGGTDNFDISKTGLIFVAKDPELNPALNTKCNLYLISLSSFLETDPTIVTMGLGDIDGALTSPVFSLDGGKVAFLGMRTNGYESDQNRIFVMPDVRKPGFIQACLPSGDDTTWSLSPQSLKWSKDGSRLYFTADSQGYKSLFVVGSNADVPYFANRPTKLDRQTTDDIRILESGDGLFGPCDRIFLSGSSLVESRTYSIMEIGLHKDAAGQIQAASTFSHVHGGSSFGLHKSQVASIWSPAADPSLSDAGRIESLVIRPSNFDPSKKYPLAFLVHGGPQSAWLNAWSTRWNPAVFSEQGYVVVCPNPTGSTGYGQRFTDGIKEQWGGLPYEDLVKCFEYIKEHVPYIDTDRAVGLGASYGGYMMNWIQGHPLGRQFKALVTHDGIFSTVFGLATEELYFLHREFGGEWGTDTQAKYAKWDPAMHTDAWATPHLIIHSEKDYRLTISDGLAAFNILQTKGVASELLTFPDETHFVLAPENSLVWHETVLGWINKHVGLPEYVSSGRAREAVRMNPTRERREGKVRLVHA